MANSPECNRQSLRQECEQGFPFQSLLGKAQEQVGGLWWVSSAPRVTGALPGGPSHVWHPARSGPHFPLSPTLQSMLPAVIGSIVVVTPFIMVVTGRVTQHLMKKEAER